MPSDAWTRNATHELLTSLGYIFDETSTGLSKGRIRRDLFGCIDTIAVGPDGYVLAIQYTDASHLAHRTKKALDWDGLGRWLQRNRFEVWAWKEHDGDTPPTLTRDIGSLYEGEPTFTRTT